MGYRNNLTVVFGLVLLFGLVLAGVLAFWFLRPGGANVEPVVLAAEGQVAQPFELRSVLGEQVTLETYRGQPVIVHFWALRCAPCKDALTVLQEIHQQYAPEGLSLVAVNHKGAQPDVSEMGISAGLSFPLLLDSDGTVTGAYGVSSFPTTFLVDAQGVVRHVKTGPLEKAELEGWIKAMMVVATPTLAPAPEATPTEEASPTPPPPPAALEGCVTTSILNGRLGPGRGHEVVTSFRKDTCMKFDGRNADSGWLRLAEQTSSDGRPLWVSAEFIALQGDISDLPVID